MKLTIYIVDAFTQQKFGGNTAAVIKLEHWLPDALMQQIAMQNNLPETVFFVKKNEGFDIKWFTPFVEIDICGHATLAAAHVLFTHLQYAQSKIIFNGVLGPVYVIKNEDQLTLNFPLDYFLEVEPPEKLIKALGMTPKEVYLGRKNYLCIYDYKEKIIKIQPDFNGLKEVRAEGIIVSAKGNDVDFVYRFFAPSIGIPEDPATGSAQSILVHYWSKQLNKATLKSTQLSARVGQFESTLKGDRVEISGYAITYLIGEIFI